MSLATARRALMLSLLIAGAAALPLAAAPRLALDSQTWPPYYLDDPAQPGFARELLQTCATSLGYETRFWPLPLEQMFSSLRSGVLDAHVLSRDPAREAFLVFGKVPVFADGYRPAVRAGSGVTIASLADFDHLRLGHLRGLRYSAAEYHEYVRRRIDAGTVVQADSNDELLRLLVDGKVDVVVALASTTRWLAKSMGLSDRVEVLPYAIKSSDYFMAVSRKSAHVTDKQGFLDAFDDCLLQLRKDGRYARLAAKYGM